MRIFDWQKRKKSFCALGLALGVLLCLLRLSDSEEIGDSCVTELCHEAVYLDGMSNPFIHTPFGEKQCDACHVEAAVSSTAISETTSVSIVQPVVVSQADFRNEHTVLLKGLVPQAAYDIYVTLQDGSGNHLRKEFRKTVPAEVQDVRADDRTAPQVFDVQAGPVSKGVFLETTITWKTDEPATSWVEYGLSDRYGRHSSEDNTLTKVHSRNIYELESGREYHFRVLSRDIFGNEAASEDFQFNTRDVSEAQAPAAAPGDGTDENSPALYQGDVFLLNSDLGVHMETSKATRITVEYLKVAESVGALGEPDAVLTDGEDSHVVLRDGTDLAIDACYQCHPAEELGVSHPVGMEPSGKTTIPDDLPTLEGGVLTCNTCHYPHGGIRSYFARKEITKDICIACHEGYYRP